MGKLNVLRYVWGNGKQGYMWRKGKWRVWKGTGMRIYVDEGERGDMCVGMKMGSMEGN